MPQSTAPDFRQPEIDTPYWLPYLDPASLSFELLAALQLSEQEGNGVAK
jgi:hypothetical protein